MARLLLVPLGEMMLESKVDFLLSHITLVQVTLT